MEPIGIESDDDDDISAISDRAAIEDEFLNEYAYIPPTQKSPIEDLHMEDSQDPNELPSSDLFSPEDKALPYVPVEETAPVKTHVLVRHPRRVASMDPATMSWFMVRAPFLLKMTMTK